MLCFTLPWTNPDISSFPGEQSQHSIPQPAPAADAEPPRPTQHRAEEAERAPRGRFGQAGRAMGSCGQKKSFVLTSSVSPVCGQQAQGAETVAWFCLVPAAVAVSWPGKAVSKLKGAGEESGQMQEALPWQNNST